MVGKMPKTGVRKSLSLTTDNSGVLRRDVIGRYHRLGFEPRLKAILLSCTVGVLGPVAAFSRQRGKFDTADRLRGEPDVG